MIDPILQSGSFQLAEKLMDASALRQEAIAANIANADTPGYHRLDLAPDFAQHLKSSFMAGELPSVADGLQPRLTEDAMARSVRADGNNVGIEKELLAMNRNSVEYNFESEVVSQNIKQLKIAISGNAS